MEWVGTRELADLLAGRLAEGPFDEQLIVREGGFLSRGIKSCYRQAAQIAQGRGYDFAVAEGATEIGDRGSVGVKFYKFTPHTNP